jgi:hypothetical protein
MMMLECRIPVSFAPRIALGSFVCTALVLSATFAIAEEQATAPACTQTLSVGANVASAVSSAANGATVCLNAGDYGTVNFTNISRTGFVTLASANGVTARLKMGEVYNSKFIRFSNLTVAGATVRGCSTNIEFWDSVFEPNTSGLAYNYDTACTGVTNMALVLDGVTFDKVQNAGYEGRLSIRGVKGIQIRNSTFSGQPTSGQSDGIQIVGNSQNVTIGPGNIFRDILQSQCGTVHCDAIQAYGGGANTVIDGNYFTNSSVYVGIYDGDSPSTVIRNNIFDTNPGGQALQIGGVKGMLMEHNTFKNITLGIGTKSGMSQHSGWIVQNNIFDNADFIASGDQPGCGTDCVMRFNLKSNGGSTTPTGTNTVTGTAIYVGTGSVSNWGNWRLAAGSPGKNAANDGMDIGSTSFGGSSSQTTTAPGAPSNVRVVR